jgi:ATP-dependent DNA ligase
MDFTSSNGTATASSPGASGVVHLWSRTGRNCVNDFPLIAHAVGRLDIEKVMIDSEAGRLLEDGRPDFHALRSRHACRDAA